MSKSGEPACSRLKTTDFTCPSNRGYSTQVGADYKRRGAVAYLAALDVFQGCVIGDVVPKSGILPCRALVTRVMTQEPYRSDRRVFWIVDNGSSHRPGTFGAWLTVTFPDAIAVHMPIHANWLNQAEIYFSILQRKALMPNDLETTDEVTARILGFEQVHSNHAKPFNWRFSRQDMIRLLQEKAA